jgi:hypothetical protein
MPNFILKSIDAKVVTLDFPSTLARKSSDIIIPFLGVSVDDFVTIDAKFPPNTDFSAWVSATDTVTIRFNNYTGSSVNLNPFTVRILVLKSELDIESSPSPIIVATQIIEVSGNKTLALTDTNNFLNITTASIITIPTDNSVNFSLGTIIYLNQSGIGDVLITPQQGVILQSNQNFKKLFGQFSQAYLIKLSANTWQLSGKLK